MKIILGPPGTGKTTEMLARVENALGAGISPQSICYVTFTRKGAAEARDRAMAKFKFKEQDLPYFKTLHSLAFHILKMETRDIMTWSDYLVVAQMLGLTISSQRINTGDDTVLGQQQTKGDRLIFMENLSRTTLKGMRWVWEQFINDDIPFEELELFQKTYAEYKKINAKIDFTDILKQFVDFRVSPSFRLLIVDEAQDLSALQWKMVNLMAERSSDVLIAGDDDQAIYSWAGADVEQFLNLKGDKIVLSKSFRVPSAIHKVARKIAEQITKRNEKIYVARDPVPAGETKYYTELEQIEHMGTGTWLLLARNTSFLWEYIRVCMTRGYMFETKHQTTIDPLLSPAIVAWESLRKGKMLPASQAKLAYSFMGSKTKIKRGYKKAIEAVPDDVAITFQILQGKFGLEVDEPWYVAFDRVERKHIDYIRFCLANGELITTKPRIVISTIHGAKGGEAENVVVMSDMSVKTYNHSLKHPDDEHRVWYVGVTRAKEKLHIILPRTQYFYTIPR